jgi:folate/biopterin transporter
MISLDKYKSSINTVVIALIALSQGLLCMADLALSYMYKDDFKLSPAQVALFTSLMTIPWIIKPLWGFISDCCPILGKRRSPYLMIFGITGATCWILLGTSSPSLLLTFVILLVIQTSVCFCNVIGEALVVEESKKVHKFQESLEKQENHENASNFVTLFFGARAAGTVLTAYFGGILLDLTSKEFVFTLTAACPVLLMLSSMLLYEEKIVSDIKMTDQAQQIYRFISRKEVFLPIFFILAFTSVPSCADAMFFFYTNQLGFSPQFMGKMKLAYGIGTIIGMVIYSNFLKNISFKKLLVFNSIFCILISLSQLLLVTRVNLRIHVPDGVFAVLCSFVVQLTAELSMIPLLVLCCKICPENIEGSLYALLMSTMNFGSMISSQSGGLLMILLQITQTEFSNLWALIMITSLSMFLPLPILYWVEDTKSSKDDYELV